MLFLQVFIRISIQFGGFSEQHQENQRTKSPQNFAGLRGQNLKFCKHDATICCKQIVNAWQCGKQIRITGFFFSGKNFFCMKIVGMSYIYHFSGLQKRKHFQIKVIHGIFRELL